MTCLSPYAVQKMAQYLIPLFNGATLRVYGAGAVYPRRPEHPLARCVVELASYQLSTPAGVFDDTGGKSQIVFTPPARLSQQPDVEGIPNFYRIYNTSNVCLYQGAARCIPYRFDDSNPQTYDNTISGILLLRPLIKTLDFRYNEAIVDADTPEWNVLPRWLDVDITEFAIDFGGAV